MISRAWCRLETPVTPWVDKQHYYFKLRSFLHTWTLRVLATWTLTHLAMFLKLIYPSEPFFHANGAELLASSICSARILQKSYDLSSRRFLLFFFPRWPWWSVRVSLLPGPPTWPWASGPCLTPRDRGKWLRPSLCYRASSPRARRRTTLSYISSSSETIGTSLCASTESFNRFSPVLIGPVCPMKKRNCKCKRSKVLTAAFLGLWQVNTKTTWWELLAISLGPRF